MRLPFRRRRPDAEVRLSPLPEPRPEITVEVDTEVTLGLVFQLCEEGHVHAIAVATCRGQVLEAKEMGVVGQDMPS